jgi:hypothetical protein
VTGDQIDSSNPYRVRLLRLDLPPLDMDLGVNVFPT